MKALVTGATGFLGGALTRRLKKMGWDVTASGRNHSKLDELDSLGIKTEQLDLKDKNGLMAACKDQEIIFHCAAFPSPWGNYEKFYQANVIGTRNVVDACQENKVKQLVYVSTPSIYFDYKSRMNVKETDQLPDPVSNYSATKILAEEEIDRAFANGLATITIRPRGIFGPMDTVISPRLIPRLRSGRLPMVGDGKNVVDLTYIENVVDALLLCAKSPTNTFGKKYNISNGEPIELWTWLQKICKELGFPSPKIKISSSVAYAIATALETTYTLIPGHPEPPLTRMAVNMISNSTTLDISAAKNELGYQPKVSMDEGFDLFMKWWKESKS